MIRLGLQLAKRLGGAGTMMSALVAAAVLVALSVLVSGLGFAAGLDARADRQAWATMDVPQLPAGTPSTITVATRTSYIGSTSVRVVDVAATGPNAPIPPGLKELPPVGAAYASPAAKELLETTAGALARYGQIVGTVANDGLRGPGDLFVVRGVTVEQASLSGVTVDTLPETAPRAPLSGVERLTLVLGVVALSAMVLFLTVIATRVGETTRAARRRSFALLGASRGQVALVGVGELIVPVIIGATLAAPASELLKRAIARIAVDGAAFYVTDLAPSAASAALATVGACFVSLALPLVTIWREPSTVEIRRNRTRWSLRLIGVVLATAALACIVIARWPGGAVASALEFTALFVVLTLSAPTISRLVGKAVSRLPGPATLIAGRRLIVAPTMSGWSASGVSLAVLVVVLFSAVAPAAAEDLDRTQDVGSRAGLAQARLPFSTNAQVESIIHRLSTISGVDGAASIFTGTISGPRSAFDVWIGSCEQIAVELAPDRAGPCPSGVLVGPDAAAAFAGTAVEVYNLSPARVSAWDSLPDSTDVTNLSLKLPSRLQSLPQLRGVDLPDMVIDSSLVGSAIESFRPNRVVFSYNSNEALESARTVVESAAPAAGVDDRRSVFDGFSADVRRLFDLVQIGALLFSLLAGCVILAGGLAISVERKSILRLMATTGMPAMGLWMTVFIECAVPPTVLALIAGMGGAGLSWTILGEFRLAPLAPILLVTLLIVIAMASVAGLLSGPLRRPGWSHLFE